MRIARPRPQPQYDFLDIFSLLLLRQNKLYDVLRVLKRIGGLVAKKTAAST